MYQYLRNMLNLADLVGHVEEVEMGNFIPHSKRITIIGESKKGGTFRLELRVTEQEVSQDD